MDILALAGGDLSIDPGTAPFRHVRQQPRGEIAHLIDAGATVRVKPVVIGEQILLVVIVNVDRIGVRHIDANGAERVPCI